MDENEEIVNVLSNYFSQKSEIDTVILFGSFAKKTFNSHSDIDCEHNNCNRRTKRWWKK